MKNNGEGKAGRRQRNSNKFIQRCASKLLCNNIRGYTSDALDDGSIVRTQARATNQRTLDIVFFFIIHFPVHIEKEYDIDLVE